MHRKVAAALVAALALALASCGGSQSQRTETVVRAATVSRAQVISRLEAACLAGQDAAQREAHAATRKAAFLKAIIANLRTIRDMVEPLETTGSAKAAFDAYKETVRTRLDTFERIASAHGAEQQRLIIASRPAIGAAGHRAHEAIVALGARHVCV